MRQPTPLTGWRSSGVSYVFACTHYGMQRPPPPHICTGAGDALWGCPRYCGCSCDCCMPEPFVSGGTLSSGWCADCAVSMNPPCTACVRWRGRELTATPTHTRCALVVFVRPALACRVLVEVMFVFTASSFCVSVHKRTHTCHLHLQPASTFLC